MLKKTRQAGAFKPVRTKLQKNDERLAYAFMFPSILYLIIWVILPIIAALVLSFTNYDIIKHDIGKLAESGISFVVE